MAMPRIPDEPDVQDEAYGEDENDQSPRVLVDASNVAHSTEGGEARLRNIQLVQEKLREAGLEPIIVADAALRHQIDDKPAYETLIDEGKVHQAPAGTDADYFILSFAREMDARILTNDRFRDRAKDFPRERNRVIRYMIVDGEVVLEHRNRRR
jgi:Zc3h12a-like Ribonuclease NYN domain